MPLAQTVLLIAAWSTSGGTRSLESRRKCYTRLVSRQLAMIFSNCIRFAQRFRDLALHDMPVIPERRRCA